MSKLKKGNTDFRYNFRIYLRLLKKYKFMFFIILFVVFVVEASQAISRFLFKVIIDRGTEFVNGALPVDKLVMVLIWVMTIFALSIILRAILNFIKVHMINRLERNLILDLKREFFNHIIHLSHRFHTSHKTGSLISRLVRGGSATERMTDVIVFNVAPLIFQILVVAGSLIYFDITSSVVVVLMAFVFIGYSIYIQIKQRNLNAIMNLEEDVEKAYISDILTNIDSIKYFGKEDIIKNRFRNLTERTGDASVRAWDLHRWFDSGHVLILGASVFFLVYFPITKFLAGTLSLGTLVFVYTMYGNLIGPLFSFVQGIRSYYRAMADFHDLFQYGKIKNEVKDIHGAKELKIRSGDIEFRNINFKYGKKNIFENFNLKIGSGQKVALVGHSGCGKSSLIKLLYRLYDVDSGSILIDGKDIREFKQESLRSGLSIVPQECVLFDDTIYNNIAFSNPKAPKEKVIKAMKFAQLYKTINDFLNKERTIVGERGVKLSGGEKQRVSIARAILADRKVLVFDEATSSLDSKTEHDIQNDLKKLLKNRTSIIIAHRLSTIMHADKVVVMEKGKIVQMGKHKDLIKVGGTYKKLWNLQKGGYIK
ncbi:ABC transporter ATP-binding protein [Candidatus Woesearchaeota archaeon]|nr:ABC transporter ATP-binding protein [Candidatus Woesearchaeota archaeon]